jgi:serine/threonine-protein kinase
MISQTLSHYRITEKIGAGGMGEVYKAHDERLDRDVAIKVLPSGTLADEHARKRFRKEALALSKLNHPNIAMVFDFDTQQGVDFIVMELVEGASLAEKVKTGPLPEKEISELGAQIADALEEAHERGIVHRDLKPGNIAVTPKGRVKVLDFGLARMLRPVSDEATTEALTQEQAVAGTLPYMSPEELRGERADHRSDLYSFGVVLYEMSAGRRPFEHTLSTALADAIIHKPPELPSTHNRKVSPGLENIIVKTLDKNPAHRYQSARDMRVDLERLTAPFSVVVPKRKPIRAGRWLLAAACVVAVIAAVFLLNVGGLRDRLAQGPGPRIDSIAVLPLENLSGDPEQEYFADGMTDELIGQLAQVSALKVISRTSVMQYKHARKPLPEIAKELNVEAVVEGTVRRSGDRVRIKAQLIEAATDRLLWASSYERGLGDILSLQSEVASEVAQEIQVVLTPEEEARLASARRVNPEAHELYMRGRYHWNRRTIEGIEKSIAHFEQALQKDPEFALAHAGLADSYGVVPFYTPLPPEEAFSRAKAAAMSALEINETLAEAHSALGFVRLYYDWDWIDAERELQRAIRLKPSYVTAYHWYAEYLSAMGRYDEAITAINRAKELDPLSPLINTVEAIVLLFARQYDRAINQFQTTLELDPNFNLAREYLGQAYVQKGMYSEAIGEFQRAMPLRGGLLKGELGHAYAMTGDTNKALETIHDMTKLWERGNFQAHRIAIVHTGLGDKEQALEWLEKSYTERDPWMVRLNVDPRFDTLRSDPQFQDLLRRMNFPE